MSQREIVIGQPPGESAVSHGPNIEVVRRQEVADGGVLATITRVSDRFNREIMRLGSIALLAAAFILTYSVLTRYFLKVSTDWQDECSVFLLVGSIFMCSAYVQSYRGHVGIEALASILPASVNRVRRFLIDVFSCAFCGFFSWKSWAMFHEAWSEGQTTESTWAPPLWIPYGLLALGMTILSLQLLLQIFAHFSRQRKAS
jgi:TRAP-type C4-dicarboxylate transport system permease small subunit